eukprot:3670137-Pyramimonas_sp.AAC.1
MKQALTYTRPNLPRPSCRILSHRAATRPSLPSGNLTTPVNQPWPRNAPAEASQRRPKPAGRTKKHRISH